MQVTLYTRRDCPLCEQAKEAMAASGVTIEEIDIDLDPLLRTRFTNDVPVIYIDGREAFRHRVDRDAFAAYVRGRRTSSTSLAAEKCVPCRGGIPPLRGSELRALADELGGGWAVVDEHHLDRTFVFPDFAQALAFTNQVGAIAEAEGHHPDIHLAWGKARITVWTHAIDGLTRADFVLAAKISQV